MTPLERAAIDVIRLDHWPSADGKLYGRVMRDIDDRTPREVLDAYEDELAAAGLDYRGEPK